MQRTTLVIVSFVAVLAALAAIWWQVKPPPSEFSRAPIIGLGQVLADETVRTVGDHGRVVVVFPAAMGSREHVPPPNGLWDGFQEELQKHGDLRIVATEVAAMDLAGCSTAAFKEIWERHADADALVFFAGLPSWDQMSGLVRPDASPKLIVVDVASPPSRLRYGNYFDSGLLQTLVSLRTGPAPVPTAKPQTPREAFDQRYQVYTREHAEALLP